MRPVVSAPAVDEPEAVPAGAPRWRRRRVLAGCAAAAVMLLVLALWWANSAGPAQLTPADVDQAVQRGLDRAEQEQRNTPPDATTAYHAIAPSLVTVATRSPDGEADAGVADTGLGSGPHYDIYEDPDGAIFWRLRLPRDDQAQG